MARRVGVEIAHSAVRVVEVSGYERVLIPGDAATGRPATEQLVPIVRRAASVALPFALNEKYKPEFAGGEFNIAGDRREVTVANIAAAVREALAAAGISRRVPVVLGASVAPATFVRGSERQAPELLVPSGMSEVELVNVLHTDDIWRYDPPASEAAFAVQPLGVNVDGKTPVAVAAMKQTDSREVLLEIAKRAKLRLRGIEFAPAATARALVRVAPDSTDRQLIVDIGATQIVCTTRVGSEVVAVRAVSQEAGGPVGGRAITVAYHQVGNDSGNTSLLEAERNKRTRSMIPTRSTAKPRAASGDEELFDVAAQTPPSPAERALEAAYAVAHRNQQAVETSLRSASRDVGPITVVTLVGGGAHQKGMQACIAEGLTGVDVRLAEPVVKVEFGKGTYHDSGLYTPDVGDAVDDKARAAAFKQARKTSRKNPPNPDPVKLSQFTTAIGLAMGDEA